jgi:hypothetical protein
MTVQEEARRIMERFVDDNGGGGVIVEMADHYKWIAPDGREARIGWQRA